MRSRLLSVFVTAAIAAVGCESSSTSTEDSKMDITNAGKPLEGTLWQLTRLNGKPLVNEPMRDTPHVIFNAATKRIAGMGSVNRFMGGYEIKDGGVISIKPGGMTMMAGPESLMDQEQAFMKVLESTRTYRVDGEKLQLLDDSGVAAELSAGMVGQR